MVMIVVVLVTVAEPDLQMKGGGGGGGGHPDPEIRGAVSKKYISAFRPSVWSKDKEEGGGGQAPMAPPLDPSLGDDNNVLAPKPFLIRSIDYNPSVIWISPKNGTCP